MKRLPNSISTRYGAFALMAAWTYFASPCLSADGFNIEQQTTAAGKLKITIAPRFFKVQLLKSGMVISSSAPDWKIISQNTKAKLYCETPVSEFNANYVNNSMQLHVTELGLLEEVTPKKAVQFRGFPAFEYPVMVRDDSFDAFKGAREERMIVLNAPNLPKAATKVVKRITGLNSIKTDLLPLEVDVTRRNGNRSQFVMTLNMVKANGLAPQLVPKDYKKVAKEADVFRDQQMQSDIQDFLEDSHSKSK